MTSENNSVLLIHRRTHGTGGGKSSMDQTIEVWRGNPSTERAAKILIACAGGEGSSYACYRFQKERDLMLDHESRQDEPWCERGRAYLLKNVYLSGNFSILLKSSPEPAYSLSLSLYDPHPSPPAPHWPQQDPLPCSYMVSFQITVFWTLPSFFTKLLLDWCWGVFSVFRCHLQPPPFLPTQSNFLTYLILFSVYHASVFYLKFSVLPPQEIELSGLLLPLPNSLTKRPVKEELFWLVF